jgi:hypothetical protein
MAQSTTQVRAGRPRGSLVRWVRTTHRWASLGFLAVLPFVIVRPEHVMLTVVLVACLAALALTGLQMNVQHLRQRRRRSRNTRAVRRRPVDAV